MIRAKDMPYLQTLSAAIRFDDIKKLKDKGLEMEIPIVEDDVGQFLYLITKIFKPKNILEIGLGGAYSTLWMQKAIGKDATITSLDLNEERIDMGRKLFKDDSRINILFQDGLLFLKDKRNEYDLIFLDAVKQSYKQHLELIEPALKKGGVFLTDNILFKGYVNSKRRSKKYSNPAACIREFNDALSKSTHFESMFLAIGDGLSLAIKK